MSECHKPAKPIICNSYTEFPKRLRELDKLKIKFLTDLSHEFRTPLSLIMGPVEKLIGVVTGSLNMVKRNARRLLNLVNQILDLRKIEEHELKLHLTEADFVSFTKEVLESFYDLSERKRIRLVFKSQLNYLLTSFDQGKIEPILFNLLSNAFKFTPEGGTISVALEKCQRTPDPGDSTLVIKITDTGTGIAPDDAEKIFDRFFQVDNAASVLNQGSGIGLSIAKEFVSMHGGSITVQSTRGMGSSFIIELPILSAGVVEGLTIDFLDSSQT